MFFFLNFIVYQITRSNYSQITRKLLAPKMHQPCTSLRHISRVCQSFALHSRATASSFRLREQVNPRSWLPDPACAGAQRCFT